MSNAHVAPWYRREDYERVQTIMDDGNKLPPAFDDWEKKAKEQLSQAAAAGIAIKPVVVDPDEFLAYCRAMNFSKRGSRERCVFAVARESAKDLN
jgi:hypothetical protein